MNFIRFFIMISFLVNAVPAKSAMVDNRTATQSIHDELYVKLYQNIMDAKSDTDPNNDELRILNNPWRTNIINAMNAPWFDPNYIIHGMPISQVIMTTKDLGLMKMLLDNPRLNIETKDASGVSFIDHVLGHLYASNDLKKTVVDNFVNRYQRLSLEKAMEGNHPLLAQHLIETNSFDVNAVHRDGNNLMNLAARYGNADLIKLLVTRGADVNARDKDGDTPMHQAAQFGNVDAIAVLAAYGADLNAKNRIGENPIHLAIQHGKIDAIRALALHGADLNAKDMFDETALISVAADGPFDVLDALVASGADVNVSTSHGHTPMHLAALNQNNDGILLMARSGANVNAQDILGATPMHNAAHSRDRRAIRELKKLGAEFDRNM